MAELAARETSKYSIAFAQADNKCNTVVQFYDEDTDLYFGGNYTNQYLDGVEIINPGQNLPDTVINEDGTVTNEALVTISGGITGAVIELDIKGGKITGVVVTNPGKGVNNTKVELTMNTQYDKNGVVLRPILGGVVTKLKDTVKLKYTDQYYEQPTEHPKTPPYPNIGNAPPFNDDYLTGSEYLQFVGEVKDGKEVLHQEGAGKVLEDLPQCIESSLRVDVIPSIWRMGYYKPASRSVNDIILISGGSGYKVLPQLPDQAPPPKVTVTISEPDEEDGIRATASVKINELLGVVESITIDNRGSGYTKTPTVTFNNLSDFDGKTAKAVVILDERIPETAEFKAYVFGGDNPTQTVVWNVISNAPEHKIIGETYTLPYLHDASKKATFSKATYSPSKLETADHVNVRAQMYTQSEVYGESIVQLTPEIMSDWPIFDYKGYVANTEREIKFWIMGGGNNQLLHATMDDEYKTDLNTTYDPVTGILTVGANETSDFLILHATDGNPSGTFGGTSLNPVDIYIFRKYITITKDEAGTDTAYNQKSTACSENNTVQLYARLRVDDRSEYEKNNKTNTDITATAIWRIEGNQLAETKIADGLLTFGYRDTIYQNGNILPYGHVWHIPNGGYITKINIVNGGSGYDDTAKVTITDTAGTLRSCPVTVTGGVITSIGIPTGAGFAPDSQTAVTGATGSGCTFNFVIDKHMEDNNKPTVFMRQCEEGEITVHVDFEGLKVKTTPVPVP
jgi:hypothetical protein